MKKLWEQAKKFLICAREFASVCFFTPLGRALRLVSPAYRRVWLISERGFEARDNGYHFFKYMARAHPEIRAWFVIDAASPDRARVEALGNVVLRASFKHRLLMGAAQRLVSTHVMGYAPDMGAYFRLDRLRLIPGIKVLLQHGIIKDDMPFMHYPGVRLDLFVCSAPREAEYVAMKYGHKAGVVQMPGLCRFDALFGAPVPEKRQILFMPTWREWIALHDAGDFTKTAYYEGVQALLASPRLHALLEAYDCTLAFYPHYEMQRFLGRFSSPSPRVKTLSFHNNDVQALLMESSALITDYSSVFFDFGYMEKPEIFYQFDEDEFRRRQYPEGYFSYRRDGFGPVCTRLEDVLCALEALLKADFQTPETYLARMRAFFALRDGNNCERNYLEILRLNAHRE